MLDPGGNSHSKGAGVQKLDVAHNGTVPPTLALAWALPMNSPSPITSEPVSIMVCMRSSLAAAGLSWLRRLRWRWHFREVKRHDTADLRIVGADQQTPAVGREHIAAILELAM